MTGSGGGSVLTLGTFSSTVGKNITIQGNPNATNNTSMTIQQLGDIYINTSPVTGRDAGGVYTVAATGSGGYAGGAVGLTSGGSDGGVAGNVTLLAGNSIGTGGTGGTVELYAGQGTAVNGSIKLYTSNYQLRLEVDGNGAFKFGGSAGTSGQVLTSSGTSAAPTWTTVASFATADDTATNATYYPAFVTAVSGTTVKTSSTKLTFNPSTGALGATILNSLSDERFKTNLVQLTNAEEVIYSLTGYSYDWLDGSGSSYGLTTQQVKKVAPNAVSEQDDREVLNYNAIIPFLVETLKAQNARIKELERVISRLL